MPSGAVAMIRDASAETPQKSLNLPDPKMQLKSVCGSVNVWVAPACFPNLS